MSRPVFSSMCRRCQTIFTRQQRHQISTSTRLQAEPTQQQATPSISERVAPSAQLQQLARDASNEAQMRPRVGAGPDEPYHLNVFSHKHNTHITFTTPTRDPILSFSAGNIGLKKFQRGSFDAAYQLAAYTFRKMSEKTWRLGGGSKTAPPMTLRDQNVKDRGIEVILRGYGNGREAFQKAMLGAEGRQLKHLVNKVTDGTRLKFGGTRSRATRRLG